MSKKNRNKKMVILIPPDVIEENPSLKDGKKKRVKTSCGCRGRIPKKPGILSRIVVKVAKAFNFMMSDGKKCSRKVSSTTTTTTATSLTRSRSYVETCLDSQRAEAIEDCIEFLHSSFSLQRSNSVVKTSSS